ncbi:MAG: ATPase, T2SS/T4P/T4SS family [Fimbriimonadales bacterium]|nr:ATPase, T2SS/T4P/T4SS family [Fimbriimonadales bacterium]
MAGNRKRLGELLLSHRLITQEQLDQALALQRERPGSLGSILVSLGHITEDLLLQALAAQHGVSAWRLERDAPKAAAVAKVPEHICRTYQVLPVEVRGDLLVLAMRNPYDLDAIDAVRNVTGMRVEPVLAQEDRLANAIEKAFQHRGRSEHFDGYVERALEEFKPQDERSRKATLTEEDTRPVVGLVNQILIDAIRMGASDIHIEPRADRVDLRYRIDGELHPIRTIPQGLMPMLTTRLKILADLDIVESRLPQDGRISVEVDGRDVDLRVSVLPNYHGQRIVLRILDKSVTLKKLDELGFSPQNLRIFRNLIHKPYGMILVTGPTGSGKTTTLYAALREVQKKTNNVMTCEDPVEYDIDGINQSQVFEKVGLTFAMQLRAILRQDPDVVLVGEIRDRETAETAIRASLTGHLVLSTLHCNDAPSAVPRLLDMGINPYLLSTSLIGVMAQRLLRTLCADCRVPDDDGEDRALLEAVLGHNQVPTIYRAKGCLKCGSTGFRGRIAVHEILPVTPEVGSLIAEQAPIEAIKRAGARYGYEPLQVDAIRKVIDGRTTLAEAQRLVFFETLPTQPAERHGLRLAA